jgi:MbtH protein
LEFLSGKVKLSISRDATIIGGIKMPADELEDKVVYKVVVNHEEQYSIWPIHRENPPGWRDGGKSGPKGECLAYIEDVWSDMRPLSLRKSMASSEV